MLKTLQLLTAMILGLLIGVPTVAASEGSQVVTLSGTLSTVHEDALGTGAEQDQFSLTANGVSYRLQFADGGPNGENGAAVTVSGKLVGNTLYVGSTATSLRVTRHAAVSSITKASTGTPVIGAAVTNTEGGSPATVSIATVLLNFSNLATKPFTASQVAQAVYGETGSAKAFFEEESKGRVTITGSVFGWYTIPSTTANCDWGTWTSQAKTAATAAGVDFAKYTHIVYIFPSASTCGFAGLGYVPGTVSVLNGNISVQVLTHELGHNFGLGHANSVDCYENDVKVAISTAANCKERAYADPFSTMGNNALRHVHASQLGELGWLADTEKVIGAPGNTYTVSSYFGTGAVKLVRIPRGDGSYFDLDFRTAHGFDSFAAGSPAVSGVTIRLGWGTASPTSSPIATQLIDTTPATASLEDAPLLVGRTLTDPVSKISFRVLSVSAAGVVVRVREGIDPTAPTGLAGSAATDGTSVDLTWSAARDNVKVAGYQISRNGTVVAKVASNVLAWTDATSPDGSSVTYAVSAIDSSVNVGPAATIVVTTPVDPNAVPIATPTPTPTPTATDVKAPSAVTSLTAKAATTAVTLTWSAATDDVKVAYYMVGRDGVGLGKVTSLTLTDAGRAPKTTYTYTVVAFDGAGHRGAATKVTVTTTADTAAPSKVLNFHKVRQSGRKVTFGWTKSIDNVKVTKYAIYKVGRSTPVATTSKTTITITTVKGAKYFARALDAAGNKSAISSTVRIRR